MEEYELIIKDGLKTLLTQNQVDEYLRKIVSLFQPDGIVLCSTKVRKGDRITDDPELIQLYRGGKHIKVLAAFVKKGYTLEDMENENLAIYYSFPQIYHPTEVKDYEYGTSETIKSKLSFVWFVLSVFVSFVVFSVLVSSYPRDRYYHIKNKRIIIEPTW